MGGGIHLLSREPPLDPSWPSSLHISPAVKFSGRLPPTCFPVPSVAFGSVGETSGGVAYVRGFCRRYVDSHYSKIKATARTYTTGQSHAFSLYPHSRNNHRGLRRGLPKSAQYPIPPPRNMVTSRTIDNKVSSRCHQFLTATLVLEWAFDQTHPTLPEFTNVTLGSLNRDVNVFCTIVILQYGVHSPISFFHFFQFIFNFHLLPHPDVGRGDPSSS